MAGGVAIPPAVMAVAEKVVDAAVAELTVRVPEIAKAADTVEHVAAAVADKIQDLSGAVPAALAPLLEIAEEVASKIEEAAQMVEEAAKPVADLVAPAIEQRAPSPALEAKPEEPKDQVEEPKSEAQ
jgi:phage/plasmid primase-like uncharacterized protein